MVDNSDNTTVPEAIAVVGLACRLPGAADPEAFWRLLRDGGDAVREAPEHRWDNGGSGPARAGYLERVDTFDPAFFKLSPREAAAVDPQQRLLLELSWEALENAGIVPESLRDTDTAVYATAVWDDYAELTHARGAQALTHQSFTGTRRAMLANRISYALGLTGPSLTVDTGQSSSLVAVHLACEALRRGEADTAVVGGVNLIITSESTASLERLGALSPNGRCHTFDARANGFVRGEGGAALVLKPLERARAEGDRIVCVIRGGAVNNDGGGDSLATPRAHTQEQVIRRAHRQAGVDPARIQYVELHGTGTPVGDPVEAAALGAALGGHRPVESPLRVGSVKTNIGHLEGAAGIAGLLKVALSLSHAQLVPSLHFDRPNPAIDLDRLRLRVQTRHEDWPRSGEPPLAGVSSFGIGGTNCHLVVSGPPDTPEPEAESQPDTGPWLLSARTPQALRDQATRLSDHLVAHPELGTADLGRSLATTRTGFTHRAALLGDRERLLRAARSLSEGRPDANLVLGTAAAPGRAVFVFPGQGPQWRGMGLELAREFPVFAETLDECAWALAPHVGWSLWERLDTDLDDSDVVQPALWAVMVSLARLWQSFGVEPAAVIGHSQGEIAAAVVAGALSIDDAAHVISLRGRLAAERLSGTGGMVALEESPADASRRIAAWDGRLSVAAANGPGTCVISGETAALAELSARCAAAGVRARRVPVEWAAHSAQIDRVAADIRRGLSGLAPRPPRIPFYSTVTGRRLDDTPLDGDYWFANLREMVRFHDTVDTVTADGLRHFVEVSAHPVLAASLRDITGSDAAVAETLRRDDGGRDRFNAALAEAHVTGVDGIDWDAVFPGARPVALPTYPFQRTPHWLAPASGPGRELPAAAADSASAPAVNTRPLPDFAEQSTEEKRRRLRELVDDHTAAVLGLSDPAALAADVPFKDAGFDSRMSIELRRRLNDATGLMLPSGVVYSHPTPRELAAHLLAELTGTAPDPAAPAPVTSPDDADPIAIVGMACRFPGGVASPEELWDLVSGGRDAIGPFPDDRGWNLDTLFDADPTTHGTTYVDQGGFLHEAADFDAAFFGISPREALTMEPQQRLLLETSWEALERARIIPRSLSGTATGVFVGAWTQEYGPRLDRVPADYAGQLLTGTASSIISGRIAYTLGLQGPAVTVDTACSASLVAIHLAAQALRQGDCELALAGGATVMSSPGMFLELSKQGALSPDGRCKAFGATADGTGWSEGAGIIVLERESTARRLGHPVLALLRGSATNQDGRSNGLTAPNGAAQERVIRAALSRAGLAPGDVDAVEAHGTGTALGDPIEAHALLATYGRDRDAADPVYLGSLKSNIGHTQAAAGVAGVIKTVMALRRRSLPKTLHAEVPSPHIDWTRGAVRPLTEARPWPERDRPRRAAVSSFGISGTNAHVILEAGPEPARSAADSRPARPLPLSARTPAALAAQAGRLRDLLTADPRLAPADLARELATTRTLMEHRAVILGGDRAELSRGLAALAAGEADSADSVVTGTGTHPNKPVFVFPGQGSQWRSMGLELAREFPVFAENLDECARALAPHVDWSLWDELDTELVDRVEIVQPALWAVMVSLARLWQSFGVEPAAVIGHSQGEIAAAVISGALSLEDAAHVVTFRCRLGSQHLAGRGGMVVLDSSYTETEGRVAAWNGRISVAAANGPHTSVVSGDLDALAELVAGCEAEGIRTRAVPAAWAGHSAQVDVLRERVLTGLAGLRPRTPRIPLYSTVTGQLLDDTPMDAEYWFANLRLPVRFHDTVDTVLADGHTCFVEPSAHPTLLTALQEIAEATDTDIDTVGSLRRDDGGPTRWWTSLSQAHVAGIPGADLKGGPADATATPLDLPTYPFQRERYWLDTPAAAPTVNPHPFAAETETLAETDTVLLTADLAATRPGWLTDHAVAGTAVLPGSAFAELARHAGDAVGCGRVLDLTIHTPLPLSDTATRVQVSLGEPDPDANRTVSIHSRALDGAARWTRHATGSLGPDTGLAVAAASAWPPPGSQPIDVTALYDTLAERGYEYGSAFQGLTAAWREGDRVHAEVALAPTQWPEAEHFGLHPALLDAALHATLIDRDPTGRVALPFAWTGFEIFATGATALRVTVTPVETGTFRVELSDRGGDPVAAVSALEFRDPPEPSATEPTRDERHVPTWVPVETVTAPRWCRWSEDLGEPMPPFVVTTLSRADLTDTVTTVLGRLHDWLSDDRAADSRLVFAVTEDTPELAAALGMIRSARAEHPDRFGIAHTLDGDTEAALSAALAALARGEDEVRVRGPEVTAARLSRLDDRPLTLPQRWRLAVPEPGVLRADPADPLGLTAGQARVRLSAHGLNFRDVAAWSGLVPELSGVGVEAAGTVTEVAPDVTGLAVGDRVMGILPDAMAAEAVTDARTLAPIPPGWTFARAAAVPAAFLTAWMSLSDRVKPGERLVVHSATGGVGLAAIQVARHLGAEVFATASPPKQHLLRQLGLDADHIASTRSLDFADRFRAATGGEGVDVVLNTLAGDFTDASLGLLRPGGRLVELGKTDVRDPDEVAARFDGVEYHYFDLMVEPPAAVGRALTEIRRLLTEGVFRPPHLTTLPVARAPEALATMRRAEHTGKIVLTAPATLDPRRTVLITGGTGTLGALLARHLVTRHGVTRLLLASRRGPEADGAAALTTDLEALGAHVTVAACDVGDRDALRNLLDGIDPRHRLGTVVHAAGILDDALVENLGEEQTRRVLAAKAHSAALLDELTRDADLDAFVLFSSVAATIGTPGQANYAAANGHLDGLARARRRLGLPAVSIAWGYWDRVSGMSEHLTEHDLARLSGEGIAAMNPDFGLAMFDAALAAADPVTVAARLDTAALRRRAAEADLPPLFRGLITPPRRRAATETVAATAAAADPMERLAEATTEQRQRELLALVRSQAAQVLRLGEGRDLAADATFREVGFDSLTAVDLRNRLNRLTGLRLPSTVVFRHANPTALAERLRTELFGEDTRAPVWDSLDRLRTQLDGLAADDRAGVAQRLRELLRDVADEPDDDLDTATDDEMFAIIDRELGLD